MTTPSYEVLGDGPTCLFPAPAGIEWYRATLPPQLFDQLRVVLIEPSDTSRSEADPAAAATISGVVNDLEQVRREVDAAEALILGHSANGLIALAYAAAHPNVTSGVIAVGTPPPGGVDRDVLRWYWDEYAEPDRKARFDALLAAGDAEPEHSVEQNRLYRGADALRRWYDTTLDTSSIDALSAIDPTWVRRVLIEDVAAQDWGSVLSRVSAPVLLVLGAYDFVVPPLLWDRDGDIAKLTKQVLARSGHQPFFDEPDAFIAIVRDWLQTHKLAVA